jgi:predicted transcriptional regulator
MRLTRDRSQPMSAVFKQEAHKLIDSLPETAGWPELIYEAALHRAIDRGMAEADAGQLVSAEALLKEFTLSE